MNRFGITNEEFKERIKLSRDFGYRHPGRFNNCMELELLDCSIEEPYAEYIFHPEEFHFNNFEIIHGAIIAGLADFGGAIACAAILNRRIITVSMTTEFLAPLKSDTILIRAEYPKIGKNISNGYIKLYNYGDPKICATATVNYLASAHPVWEEVSDNK